MRLLPYPATMATLTLTKHRIYEKTGTVALEYAVVKGSGGRR